MIQNDVNAIKATLTNPKAELSLFDCIEMNERAHDQGQVARAAIRQWRMLRNSPIAVRDITARTSHIRLSIFSRRLAMREVRAYLRARRSARRLQSYYLAITAPVAFTIQAAA